MGHKHEIQNQTLKRLAERVLDGDVVFFVGAGFSIDSEGNSTHRMMRRLVLRLLAMAAETEARGITTGRELLGDFVRKFHLDPGNLLARAKDPMKARLRWLTVKGLGKRGASQAIDSDEALENDAFEIAPYFSRACTDPKEVALIQQLMRSLGEWPLQRLGSEYYEVNDWFCRAFERLLHLGAMDENSLRGIGIREEEYRQEMNAFLVANQIDRSLS